MTQQSKALTIAALVAIFLTVQTSSPGAQDLALHYVANTRPPGAFLALRTHPSSATGSRITKMPNGTALEVLQRRLDGWWYVRAATSGQEGWALSGQGNRSWIECCRTAAVRPSTPSRARPTARSSPVRQRLLLGVQD